MEDHRESKIICRRLECRYHKAHRKRGVEIESQKQCGIAAREKGEEELRRRGVYTRINGWPVLCCVCISSGSYNKALSLHRGNCVCESACVFVGMFVHVCKGENVIQRENDPLHSSLFLTLEVNDL